MWKHKAISIDCMRHIVEYSSSDLYYCLPVLFELLEEKGIENAADALCRFADPETKEGKDFLRIYPGLMAFLKSYKHTNSAASDKVFTPEEKIIQDLLSARKSVFKVDGGTTVASSRTRGYSGNVQQKTGTRGVPRNTGGRFRGRNRAGTTHSDKSNSSNNRVTSSFVEQDIGPDTLLNSLRDIKPLLKNRELEAIQKVVLFILCKNDEHENASLFSEEHKAEILPWCKLYMESEDDDYSIKGKRNLSNQFVQMIQKMISDDDNSVLNVMVLEELCTFLIRNSDNFDITSKIIGGMVWYGLQNVPEADRGYVESLFSFIVFSTGVLFPYDACYSTSNSILPDPRERQREHVRGNITPLKYSDMLPVPPKEGLKGLYKQTHQEHLDPIIKRLFNSYKFEFIVIGVISKYKTCPKDWQKAIKPYVPAHVATDLLDHQEEDYERFAKLTPKMRQDTISASRDKSSPIKSRIVLFDEELMDLIADFHEIIQTLNTEFVEREISRYLEKKDKSNIYKISLHEAKILFGTEFKKMIQGSLKFSINFELVNLVRAAHMSRAIVDQDSDRARSVTESNPSVGGSNTVANIEEYHLDLVCDVLLESIEELYHSFVSYIRFYSKIDEILAKFTIANKDMMQEPIMRTKVNPHMQAVRLSETVRGDHLNQAQSNNLHARPNKKKANTAGSTANKKTGTRGGSSFTSITGGRNKFNISEYFDTQCGDLPGIRGASLREILLMPFNHFTQLESKVNELSRNLDQNKVLSNKAKLLQKKLQECVSNLEAERDMYTYTSSFFGTKFSKHELNTAIPTLAVSYT